MQPWISSIRHVGRILPAAAFAALAAGCASDPSGPGGTPKLIDRLPRDLAAVEQEVIGASNRFAFDLLREANAREQEHANVVLSPFSASMALGMTMNGTAGDTYDQMQAMLGFDGLSRDEVNASYRGLLDMLLDLDPQVELNIANSVWAREGMPFLQSFYDVVEQYFDADARSLDFDRPDAEDVINAWVAENTNDRIEQIVEQVDSYAMMFLINAVYFKADWREQFKLADTRPAPFRRDDGTSVEVPMMSASDMPVRLGSVDGVQIGELPYGGDAFTMVLVVPQEGASVASLVSTLDADTWNRWVGSLGTLRDAPVSMPRYEVEWKGVLNETLQALGMTDAFRDGIADFSLLAEQPFARELFVREVVQKTWLRVDEEGTEAAAATSVGVGVTSMPLGLRVDRSFLMAIRERHSGTILFLGMIDDPSDQG